MELAYYDDDVVSKTYSSRARNAAYLPERLGAAVARAILRAPNASAGKTYRGGVTVVTNRTALGPLVYRCTPTKNFHSFSLMDPWNYSEFDGQGDPQPGEVDALSRGMLGSDCRYVGPKRLSLNVLKTTDRVSPTQVPINPAHIIDNRLWVYAHEPGVDRRWGLRVRDETRRFVAPKK